MAEWCRNAHCSDPATACGDLMEDIEAAKRLTAEFPDRVRLVRHEDISLNTVDTVKQMLSFLNLPWHASVQRFITSHMQSRKVKSKGSSNSASNPYSTVRNSTETVLSWVEKLSPGNVTRIQEACSSPMKALGYKPLESSRKTGVHLEDILLTRDNWTLQ